MAQGADDQPPDQPGIAEADLRLGGMDIDIDLAGRAVEKQRDDRVAILRQHVLIGAAHRPDEQLVPHRPAIDDEVLVARDAAIEGRQADLARQAKALPFGRDRHRILGEIAPEQRRQPRLARRRRRQTQQDPLIIASDRESDPRAGHCQPPHRIDRLVALAAGRLEEFEARRRREEQVAHLDPRAAGMGSRHWRVLDPALDGDLPGALGLLGSMGWPRDDAQPADRADRRQGFAAKSEHPDLEEVVIRQFRGAVTLDGQRQLVAAHALAVIGDGDQRLAAFPQRDVDARRAGIDRILDEFLDRRRRPLDDLAGGDTVNNDTRQLADRHRPILRQPAGSGEKLISAGPQPSASGTAARRPSHFF